MTPVLSPEEAKRRGQAALDFYNGLCEEPGDDFKPISVTAAGPERFSGGLAGVQKLIARVFGA